MDLIETASLMLNPKESEEAQKMKAESIRKEDGRKGKGRERKECEARLEEHAELMEFPADGSQNCKQMLDATLNGCLKREIGLIK